MKNKKRATGKGAARAAPARPSGGAAGGGLKWRLYGLGAAAVAVFWAYWPAMRGAFLFDDTVLPFSLPHVSASLGAWLHGQRPVLMLTYMTHLYLRFLRLFIFSSI